MTIDEATQEEITAAINEVMGDLLYTKYAVEYHVKVTINLIGDAQADREKIANATLWVKEKNIPYKTNFLFDVSPPLCKEYFFKNERDALLFLLSVNN